MVIGIVRSPFTDRIVMAAYYDDDWEQWRYRKRIETPEGKKIRIKGTPGTNTMKAAEAAERNHIERIQYPERVAARAAEAVPQPKEALPTLKEFSERFLDEYGPRQKPSERYSKERIVKGHLVPFFGAMGLDDVATNQSKVNQYVKAQTVSTGTVNNRLGVLSTLLTYAGPTGCGLIPQHTLSLHIDDVEAEILAVPQGDVDKLVKAATDDRYKVAVLLASEAGLRIGEIRGLQWTDIKTGRVTIRRAIDQRNNVGPPKHNKIRTVRLSSALEAALAKLPRRGLWVITRLEDGGFLSYWAMWEAIVAIYKGAAVDVPKSETGKSMPWHSLRHTFGTECAARGVHVPEIQKLMGHSDIATTMRYVSVSQAQLDAAITRAFDRSGPTAGPQLRENSPAVESSSGK
jgi:integrase